jgi:hypothetical protein
VAPKRYSRFSIPAYDRRPNARCGWQVKGKLELDDGYVTRLHEETQRRREQAEQQSRLREVRAVRPGLLHASPPRASCAATAALHYSDAKVANRDTKVWHGATESGP